MNYKKIIFQVPAHEMGDTQFLRIKNGKFNYTIDINSMDDIAQMSDMGIDSLIEKYTLKFLEDNQLDKDSLTEISIYLANDDEVWEYFNSSNRSKTDWDQFWMGKAIEMSLESKCQAHKVGAIITYNNAVISSGINGTPAGYVNCSDIFRKVDGVLYTLDENSQGLPHFSKAKDQNEHHEWSNIHESHAELNAIGNINFPLMNVDKDNLRMYITHTPCFNCGKLIIKSGIKELHVAEQYDRSAEVLGFLEENGVKVVFETEYEDVVNGL